MEKCHLSPSKTCNEGLENFLLNEHQDFENVNNHVLHNLLEDSNSPLNREICTDAIDQVCDPIMADSKLQDERQELTPSAEVAATDEQSSQCCMKGNLLCHTSNTADRHDERHTNKGMKEKKFIKYPSNNEIEKSSLKMSTEALPKIAEIIEITCVETLTSNEHMLAEKKYLPTQTRFQSILKKSNKESETPEGTTPIALNESEKFELFENEQASESIIIDDITEMSVESMPATPRVLLENSANENHFSHSDGSSASVTDTLSEKCTLDRPDTPKVLNLHSPKDLNNLSLLDEAKTAPDSLRRSIDSQISESSSSVRSSTESDTTSRSNSLRRKSELDRDDDSSSPLLMRKKRKRDVFKDTDGEEDLEDENDTIEKSFGYKSQKYKHQTHVSDNEEGGSCSIDSKKMKFKSCSNSDFELMMEKKREERQKGRKRGNGFITSNDDLIDQLIDRMEEAAYEDRILNKKGQPAVKKVSLLKYAISQLRKKDLQPIFLEHNILSTLTEWLSPLPSRCLPCLQIRENILRLLLDFPRIEARLIRHSGLGHALKFLRDHTDEIKENKERCSSLIEKWTRPIHDSSSDYRFMTKRERQQRDYELSLRYAKQKSKNSAEREKAKPKTLDITLASPPKTEASRPGEPGWVPRARVPQLSVRDYINRPESKLECEIMTKLKPSRFEILSKKYQRTMRDKVFQRSSAKLSIVGDKM